jgi:hypothetical protein
MPQYLNDEEEGDGRAEDEYPPPNIFCAGIFYGSIALLLLFVALVLINVYCGPRGPNCPF